MMSDGLYFSHMEYFLLMEKAIDKDDLYGKDRILFARIIAKNCRFIYNRYHVASRISDIFLILLAYFCFLLSR